MSVINQQIAELIESRSNFVAQAAAERYWIVSLCRPYQLGDPQLRRIVQVMSHHIAHLSSAIAVSSTKLFVEYLCSVLSFSEELKQSPKDITCSLNALSIALKSAVPIEVYDVAIRYITSGIEALPSDSDEIVPVETESNPYSVLKERYTDLLLAGDRHAACDAIMDAKRNGVPVKDIYLQVIQPSLYEIGRLWETQQISVGQEHKFSAGTQLILAQLYLELPRRKSKHLTMVASCVAGERHDFGCRMLADFFDMDGWNAINLGPDTPPDSILQAITEHQADILAISVTMPYYVERVADAITLIRKTAACQGTKVMVGGQPFIANPTLWRETGADLFAPDPEEAIRLALKATKSARVNRAAA